MKLNANATNKRRKTNPTSSGISRRRRKWLEVSGITDLLNDAVADPSKRTYIVLL